VSQVSYSVLELAENGTFSSFIKKNGPLGDKMAKFPFMQM
jgi:hypothetical protein